MCLGVTQEHLRRHGHIEAMRALEREAGVEADVLGRDAAFLRTLVMDGRWEDVITLLEVSDACPGRVGWIWSQRIASASSSQVPRSHLFLKAWFDTVVRMKLVLERKNYYLGVHMNLVR